jgi:hypothetical protein
MCKQLSRLSNLLLTVLVASHSPWAAAQSPPEWGDRLVLILEQPGPPPPGRGPPQSEDEFLAREVWKLREKLAREGARFDVDRELSRLADRLSKDFGGKASAEDFRILREELRERQSTVPPEGLGPLGPPPGKGPPRSREEFVSHELQKLGEKRAREGDRFDPHRELQKLWEKYQRDSGEPLPQEDWAVLTSALEVAAEYPAAISPRGARPVRALTPTDDARSSSGRTLPDWYLERDRDGDGQLGLYEWPRGERLDFSRWDINGDGFLTPQEIHQFQPAPGPTAAGRLPLHRP